MNIVSKRVLAGAAVIIAHACATPVDISDDVLTTDPSEFGDAGVFAGAGGGASGGNGGDVGDGAGGTAQAGTGGSASPGGTSGATGGTFQAGLAGSGSLGGGAGEGSAGGSGGASAGTGGVAAGGSGGDVSSGGTTASAGTGGAVGTAGASAGGEPVFDADACDFGDLTGCEDLSCATACPGNDGGSCSSRCEALITCVSTDPACAISEDDPLCATRSNGAPNACTNQADSAGGATTTTPTQPAFVARQFVECICSNPRP